MFRYLKVALRGLGAPARAAWRQPWLTLALTSLFLAGATPVAAIWYGQHCWEAAQAALAKGQPAEARSHLDVCLVL